MNGALKCTVWFVSIGEEFLLSFHRTLVQALGQRIPKVCVGLGVAESKIFHNCLERDRKG